MFFARLRLQLLFICCLFTAAFSSDTTITISTTSTTTAHITATDYSGACDNFVGACVVYGTNGGAAYTTTVYRWRPRPHSPPTPVSTIRTTTTFLATTTVSDAGACTSFTGACVVYGGSRSASTVYVAASSGAHGGVGNGNGYIGANLNGGQALILEARQVGASLSAIAGLIFVLLALL